jgi:hypothetical protein
MQEISPLTESEDRRPKLETNQQRTRIGLIGLISFSNRMGGMYATDTAVRLIGEALDASRDEASRRTMG